MITFYSTLIFLYIIYFMKNTGYANWHNPVTLLDQGRFSKEVQPTLSLNLNSELTYSEMGNSEFSVTEQAELC